MTPGNLPYVLHGLLIVAVVLAWFYSPWQGLLIARSRERLIELRHQWFMLISREPVSAEHPAARKIGRRFDAQIRSLPCMSLPIILLGLLVPNVPWRALTRLDSVLPDLPEGTIREGARRLQEQAALTIGFLIVMRSLMCCACVVLFAPVVAFVALGLLVRRALGADEMSLLKEMLCVRGILLRKLQALTDAEPDHACTCLRNSTKI